MWACNSDDATLIHNDHHNHVANYLVKTKYKKQERANLNGIEKVTYLEQEFEAKKIEEKYNT